MANEANKLLQSYTDIKLDQERLVEIRSHLEKSHYKPNLRKLQSATQLFLSQLIEEQDVFILSRNPFEGPRMTPLEEHKPGLARVMLLLETARSQTQEIRDLHFNECIKLIKEKEAELLQSEEKIKQMQQQLEEEKASFKIKHQHLEEELKNKEVEIQQLRLKLIRKEAPKDNREENAMMQKEQEDILLSDLSPQEVIEAIRAEKGIGVSVCGTLERERKFVNANHWFAFTNFLSLSLSQVFIIM